MAYNKKEKQKIVADIKKAIAKHKLTFFYQVFAFVACCQETGTNILKDLEELEAIKELLSSQKTLKKIAALKRWETSENATLEVAYYKLLANEDELERLNNNRQKIETDNKHQVEGSIELVFEGLHDLPANESDIEEDIDGFGFVKK